jgi:hypothetical protein
MTGLDGGKQWKRDPLVVDLAVALAVLGSGYCMRSLVYHQPMLSYELLLEGHELLEDGTAQ